MDLLKYWREAGWQEVDKRVYTQAYTVFGGSVITHPLVLETVSRMTAMPLRYFAHYRNTVLKGAIAVWGKYLAGSKIALKKAGKSHIVDTGNAEFILPLCMDEQFDLKFKGQFLSLLHKNNILRLKEQKKTTLSFTKSYKVGSQYPFSKKFKYNHRREFKQFEASGGRYESVASLSSQEFAAVYSGLFHKRWGRPPKGYQRLAEFVECIKPLQTGFVLYKEDDPVAIQLVLQTESPEWVSAEYINGGVDPAYKTMSIGSVLSYLNTSTVEEYAGSKQKELRFSFGKTDAAYKKLWCFQSPVFFV